jgi:hypothetical protein
MTIIKVKHTSSLCLIDFLCRHYIVLYVYSELWRIFGRKRDEVTGDWRKLHNEELPNLYSSPNIIRISSKGRRAGQGMWHEWGEEKCI